MMSISLPLDYQNLFELSDPFLSQALRLSTGKDHKTLTFDDKWPLFRGITKPNEPLILESYMGSKPKDYLWSGYVHIFCVSNRVIELLRTNAITGWSTYPVEVFDRKGVHLPGYHGFSVTGSECKRDRSRSQIVERQAIPGGVSHQVYKGLFFDESDWDGKDFFYIGDSGGMVVTRKVYDLFKKEKITNVLLTPLLEVEIDVLLDKYSKKKE